VCAYYIFISFLIQSDATWQKTKTCYSAIINSQKVTLLNLSASWLSPNVTKMDFLNIIVSFKDLFDLSTVFMQKDMTSLFADADASHP